MKDIRWKYVKEKGNKEKILAYQNEHDIKFPDDYIDCVMEYQGGTPKPNVFDTIKNQERILKSLLSFCENKNENIFAVTEWLKDRIPKELIPFANDPSGNYICFEYANDNNPKVVYWNHETNEIEYVAESFSELLDKLYE